MLNIKQRRKMKNITVFSLVAAALLFAACGEKTKEAANTVTEAVKEDTSSLEKLTKQAVIDAAETAKAKAAEMAKVAKEEADKLAAAAAEKAAEMKAAAEAKAVEMAEAAKVEAEKLVKEAAEKAAEVKAATEAKAAEITTAVTEAVSSSPSAYAKCKGCHGVDGKMKALGKSAVIAGQDKAAIIASMNAYKAGTKDVAGMGSLMRAQAMSMSDEDIEAVADYLSGL